MELSCRILFSRLSERFPVLAQNYDHPEQKIRESEFYFSRNVLRKKCIYILDASAGELDPAGFPAVYCGCVPKTKKGTWIALEAEAGQIIYALSSIFRLYEKWEEGLKQAVLSRESVERLLELAETELKRPVFFLNRYFVIKASAGTETLPFSKQVFSEEEDAELISALMHDKVYKENISVYKPFFMPARVLPFNSVNINLGKDRDSYGMLCAVEDRPESWENTAELLSTLSVYVDYLSVMEDHSGRSIAGPASVLHDMLSDMNSDYDEATGRLDAYGWSDEDEYLCACFLTEGGKTPVGTPDSVCRKIGDTYPGSCAFRMEDKIICYFNLSRTEKEREAFFNELTLLIREYYLRTGYSRPVRGKRHLRRQYRQALFALEKGMSSATHRWVFHFDEFAPEFLKERVLQAWPPQLLVHPGLEALMKSDADNGTDYMNTLKTMLDCGMSATAAAERLFIHRSTLLYRMDKIKALLDSRLDNPKELTYLSVSFFLMGK